MGRILLLTLSVLVGIQIASAQLSLWSLCVVDGYPRGELPGPDQMSLGSKPEDCAEQCKTAKDANGAACLYWMFIPGLKAGFGCSYGYASAILPKFTSLNGGPNALDFEQGNGAKSGLSICLPPASTTTSSTVAATSTTTRVVTTTPVGVTLSPVEQFLALPQSQQDMYCCTWAKTGACDSNIFFMRPYCQTACGTLGCTVGTAPSCAVTLSAQCGGTAATAAPATQGTTPRGGTACADTIGNCSQWSRTECTANPYYMKIYCANYCSSCGTTTADLDREHNACANAVDKHSSCGYWKSMGECSKNPAWMNVNCQASCGVC